MKTITITLHKTPILDYVDGATFKRTDATLVKEPERSQGAISSDSEDTSDAFLLDEYCDRRDARLRSRLKFALVETEESLTFDNTTTTGDKYEYKLNVDDSFTSNDLQSIGKRMDEYIKRGAVFSWYLQAGIEPTDSEQSIQELEDDIAATLRGQSWGHRPVQPFGARRFSYIKGAF